MKKWIKGRTEEREVGQSLILIAFLIVGLVAFLGLAVDVGFVWLRGSQLTKAVDSASLAGASELGSGIGATIADANQVAKSFLYSNDIPADVVELPINNDGNPGTRNSRTGSTILGARTYSLTITWPVELFFLRILGFEEVQLARRATAAYFPLVDIYASRRVEDGVINTSTQSVFGPQICTEFGDPFAPNLKSDGSPNPWRDFNDGIYQFRMAIPADYEARTGQSLLRVELFDPDTYNRPLGGPDYTIIHTDLFSNTNGTQFTTTSTCTGGDRRDACLIRTCEWDPQDDAACAGLTQFDNIDDINPFWFVRIDENRGAGTPPGNGLCGLPANYTNGFNTVTQFVLYYFRQQADGTITRVDLARYSGQSFDPTRDLDVEAGAVQPHGTDMHWVTPGALNSVQDSGVGEWGNALPGGAIPVDCSSATGGYSLPGDDALPDPNRRCPGQPYSPPASGRGFEINLSTHLQGILTASGTGTRYIYIDVVSLSGSSENDFEFWAGPPYDPATNPDEGPRPADVNARNLWHLNNPGIHGSAGVSIFALGTLPMNSLYTEDVRIPLLYVGPEYAGGDIEVALYDPDSGTQPPVTFYFDTISPDDYNVVYAAFDCGGPCNEHWVGDPNGGTDPFIIPVPEQNDQCSSTGLTVDCTPFYGGNLMIEYQAGAADTYRWVITLPSLPFLIE